MYYTFVSFKLRFWTFILEQFTDISEEFDGSSWSEGDDLNTARQDLGGTGAGTQTAGLMAAGNVKAGGTTTKQLCESYKRQND